MAKGRGRQDPGSDEHVVLRWETNGSSFPRFHTGLILNRKNQKNGMVRYLVGTVQSRHPFWIAEGIDGVSGIREFSVTDNFLFQDYMFHFLTVLGDTVPNLIDQFNNGLPEYIANLNLERRFKPRGSSDPPSGSPENPPDA